MKLIIVDDEPAVRGSIKMLCNPELLGFTHIEEASDGIEALEKIEKTRFDVMITDMRMPGMDGIGLLNSLNEDEMPSTIVLSAWHDFEYMRLAMHKKAVDYILKPIKQAELIAALRRAAVENGKNAPHLANDKISALWWPISGYPKNAIMKSLDKLKLNKGRKQVLYLRIFAYKNSLRQKYGDSRDLMFYHIEQSLSDFLLRFNINHDLVMLNESAEMIAILHDNPELPEICKQIEALITNAISVNCVCEKRQIKADQNRIFTAYKELRLVAGERKIDLSKLKLVRQDNPALLPAPNLDDLYSEIKIALLKLDLPMMLASINRMESKLANDNYLSYNSLGEIIIGFLNALAAALSELGTNLSNVLENFDGILDFGSEITSSNIVKVWMEEISIACIEQCFQVKKKKCNHMIKSILNYIEANYTLDIGLEDLTKQFHMSREHISRMFKKETGENFISYLTQIRMKKAAELILLGKFNMQEVSEQIGLNDSSYFSRSFKKYYGLTPEEFKKRQSV